MEISKNLAMAATLPITIFPHNHHCYLGNVEAGEKIIKTWRQVEILIIKKGVSNVSFYHNIPFFVARE